MKLTAHAAWIITLVVFARCVYASSDFPRVGWERVQGRQVTTLFAAAESVKLVNVKSSTVGGVGEKGSRPGLPRAMSDLETRSWAARGEEARTRHTIWEMEDLERSEWRIWAPRPPVAPVRSCDLLVGFLFWDGC